METDQGNGIDGIGGTLSLTRIRSTDDGQATNGDEGQGMGRPPTDGCMHARQGCGGGVKGGGVIVQGVGVVASAGLWWQQRAGGVPALGTTTAAVGLRLDEGELTMRGVWTAERGRTLRWD